MIETPAPTCLHCGKHFQPKSAAGRLFCSQRCGFKQWTRERKTPPEPPVLNAAFLEKFIRERAWMKNSSRRVERMLFQLAEAHLEILTQREGLAALVEARELLRKQNAARTAAMQRLRERVATMIAELARMEAELAADE